MKLSVVLMVHDMRRQAMRTIRSLLPPYQEEVSDRDYELIVVENDSADMLDGREVETMGPNVRYLARVEPGVSPVPALNEALALTRGEMIGILIDGARMMTPGVIAGVLRAGRMEPRVTVAVPGYQLGPEPQNRNPGYNAAADTRRLEKIDWPDGPRAGYRLFEVASLSEANPKGIFRHFIESNAIFAHRAVMAPLLPLPEAFDQPGGGAINLWLYHQLLSQPDTAYVVLPGEGSVHQVHGGVTTHARDEGELEDLVAGFRIRLEEVLGHRFAAPHREAILLGRLAPEMHETLAASAKAFQRGVLRGDRVAARLASASPDLHNRLIAGSMRVTPATRNEAGMADQDADANDRPAPPPPAPTSKEDT